MPIVFLKPTGQTDAGSNIASGVLTDVDEKVSAADAALEVSINKQWVSPFFIDFTMEDLPANAISVNSFKFRVRARITGTWVDDDVVYSWFTVGFAQEIQWDFETEGGDGFVNKEITQFSNVSDVNDIVVRVQQIIYVGSMAKENVTLDWDCFELEVDYEAASVAGVLRGFKHKSIFRHIIGR